MKEIVELFKIAEPYHLKIESELDALVITLRGEGHEVGAIVSYENIENIRLGDDYLAYSVKSLKRDLLEKTGGAR